MHLKRIDQQMRGIINYLDLIYCPLEQIYQTKRAVIITESLTLNTKTLRHGGNTTTYSQQQS